MPNTARFSSELFNSTVPHEYFINESCFGDDVGRYLKEKLEARGYKVSDPDQEDWGWYLDVKKDGKRATLNISLYEGEDGVQWQLYLEVSVALLTKVFGVPDKEVSPALVEDLRQILESEDDIRHIVWLELDERGGESVAAEA